MKKAKGLKNFETIVQKLTDFKNRKLQMHSVRVKLVIDMSILAYFAFSSGSDARAFSLSFRCENREQLVRFLTLMSPPANMQTTEDGQAANVTIDAVFLPHSSPIRLYLGPYSITGGIGEGVNESNVDWFTSSSMICLNPVDDSDATFLCSLRNDVLQFDKYADALQ